MPIRPLSAVLALLFLLTLPDTLGRLEELATRLESLEQRVTRIESLVFRSDASAETLAEEDRLAARLDGLAARLGVGREELATLSAPQRAWALHTLEAALQAWLIATQVAGNEKLLPPDERVRMAEPGHRREAGRALAATVGPEDSPAAAWQALEGGVRELFGTWLRRAGRSDDPARIEALLVLWRASSVVIVREPLDRGAQARAELAAAAR